MSHSSCIAYVQGQTSHNLSVTGQCEVISLSFFFLW